MHELFGVHWIREHYLFLGLTDWTIGLDYTGLTFLAESFVTKPT